jgi:NADH-quinone oxidoreductase subunit J
VHSVLFLILTFFITGIIVLILEAEFLGFLFIMIYVGAIAVLFLFVIMMINTKKEIVKEYIQNILILNITGVCFFAAIYFFIFDKFFDVHEISVIFFSINNFSLLLFDKLSSIQTVGQIIFNAYGIAVVISGLILLVALVGSISLTIMYKDAKNLDKSYQDLSRKKTVKSII